MTLLMTDDSPNVGTSSALTIKDIQKTNYLKYNLFSTLLPNLMFIYASNQNAKGYFINLLKPTLNLHYILSTGIMN